MAFQRVCKLEEIPAGKALSVDAAAEKPMLIRSGDQVLACSRICLHRGGDLSGGELEGSVVTCPLHFWKYELKDGQCLQVPSSKLKTYVCKIENGEVFIDA
jgi:nitrite reductase (NADH) small subunit